MSDGLSEQLDESTTVAHLRDGRYVYFTELVSEGDVVDVYPTFEQAEDESGPSRKMVVRRTDGEWWLEDSDAD